MKLKMPTCSFNEAMDLMRTHPYVKMTCKNMNGSFVFFSNDWSTLVMVDPVSKNLGLFNPEVALRNQRRDKWFVTNAKIKF